MKKNTRTNLIQSKSNLMLFDLSAMVSKNLNVVITGVHKELTDEEKTTAKWIMKYLRFAYVQLVSDQYKLKMIQFEAYKNLIHKRLTCVFRPNLDIEELGVLVDDEVPFIHLHLGHGDKSDPQGYTISVGESGRSEFFNSSEYVHHFEQNNGQCWLALFPFCYGSGFAFSVAPCSNVHATWGSVDDAPGSCWDALTDLPSAMNHEFRAARILSSHLG